MPWVVRRPEVGRVIEVSNPANARMDGSGAIVGTVIEGLVAGKYPQIQREDGTIHSVQDEWRYVDDPPGVWKRRFWEDNMRSLVATHAEAIEKATQIAAGILMDWVCATVTLRREPRQIQVYAVVRGGNTLVHTVCF